MRKVRVFATAVFMLLIASSTAYTDVTELHDMYFSDVDFNYQVGDFEKDCDGNNTSWGTTSDVWGHVMVGCATGQVITTSCKHWTGTTWEDIQCYWDGPPPNYGGRLRVPIG